MDIASPNWSERREDNGLPAPDGFKSGAEPDDVPISFREVMAAVKREWNLSRPALHVAATDGRWVYDPGVTPGALVDGMILATVLDHGPPGTNTNWTSLQVDGLGSAKTIAVLTRDGTLAADYFRYLPDNVPAFFYWDASLNRWILFSQPGREYLLETIECVVTAETEAVAAGTKKFVFRLPYRFVVSAVAGSLTVAQTSGTILTIDVNIGAFSVLTTGRKLTIDNTEKTSATAALSAVVQSLDPVASNDAEVTIDVDQIGDGTAKGLKVYITGYQA